MWSEDSIHRFFDTVYDKHKKSLFSEAENGYRKILLFLPAHASVHGLIGALFAQVGDVVQASRYLQRALLVDPYNAATYSNLGNIKEVLGIIAEGRDC